MSVNLDTKTQKRTAPDQDSIKRVRLEANPLLNLPEDLWNEVASYLNKSDLKSLYQVSKFDQKIALKALNHLEMSTLTRQLKDLENLSPNQSQSFINPIDLYKNILYQIRLHPEIMPFNPEREQELQKKLTTLATDHIAKEFFDLRQYLTKGLLKNEFCFKDIELKYKNLSISFIAEALNDVVSANMDPIQTRGVVVASAAINGYFEIVRVLLDNGPISEMYRSYAIQSSINQASPDIPLYLLENGDVSENARDSIIINAARCGQPKILESALKKGNISFDARISAVWHAVEANSFEMVEALLETGDIDQNMREMSLIVAAQKGNLAIVNRLLASGDISYRCRGNAVLNAIENGHEAVVLTLIENGGIDSDLATRAEFAALNKNLTDAAKALAPFVNRI